jgi:serine/threonine protein kinase
MHKSSIVHRDIKSHNVLLDDNFKVKLCDFGLAKHYVIYFYKFLFFNNFNMIYFIERYE